MRNVLLSVLLLAGCSHLTQYTNARPDAATDEAFVKELVRLDAEVRACYAKQTSMEAVPLELAVDETGAPIAAVAKGPMYGSTLGGCLETVAFRANLGAGNGRRMGHAIASLAPVVVIQTPVTVTSDSSTPVAPVKQ